MAYPDSESVEQILVVDSSGIEVPLILSKIAIERLIEFKKSLRSSEANITMKVSKFHINRSYCDEIMYYYDR